MNLKLIHENFTQIIELDPVAAPETCREIYYGAPFNSDAQKWRQEIYFKIPVSIKKENQSARVEKGTAAYFPPMKVLCIFYGNTQPVAPVNIIGRVDKPENFARIRQGDLIRIERC